MTSSTMRTAFISITDDAQSLSWHFAYNGCLCSRTGGLRAGREQQLNHTPREMRCAASILDESVLQQAQQQQDTESIYEGLC